ncbi:hypothetical protein MMC29_006814, partial [Sticta canariensis]|nr:hypothetical protein [Sticta canariensis]
MEQVGVLQAENVGDAEDQQDQQFQQLQLLKPQNTRESLEPNLTPYESPHLKQALASGLLDHRYNQSACGIVDNCFVTWHPSILPLHLQFSFKFLGSDSASRYLAFVLNDKTDHPILYAIELVAAVRKRLLEAKAETQLLLEQLNKIMAESFTHPWWLPIVAERVRQNTIKHAQKINASHQDLQNLDLEAVQGLGTLINEGKIDANLLFPLISSSDQPLVSTEPTGIDSFKVNRAEFISQQGSSKFPNDGSGAQLSHDASIAGPAKKDLKNQRKKDKKQAKRLATNQAQTQHSAPKGPIITQRDASAISTESDHPEDPTNAQLNAPDILSALENLEDPTVAKPNFSAISSGTEHPASPTTTNPYTSDIVDAPEPLEDAIFAEPNLSANSTEPELPADPTITNSYASDIVDALELLGDTTVAKPDVSASSTESELPADPTIANLYVSDISNAQEPFEDPIVAKPDLSAFSTELELSADSTIINPYAPDISNALKPLEDPTVAKPDVSAISTEPGRLEDPVIVKPPSSAISMEPEHPEDHKNTKTYASDILNEPQRLEYSVMAKLGTSAISTEQEHDIDHPILAKPGILAKSTEPKQHLSDVAITKPVFSVSTQQQSEPSDISTFKLDLSTIHESEDFRSFKTDLPTKIKSENTQPKKTRIQSDVFVLSTGLDSMLPADLDKTTRDTVRIEAGSSVRGSDDRRNASSPQFDLTAPISSCIVSKNNSAEPHGSASSINPESTLKNGSDPEPLALPPACQKTEDLISARSNISALTTSGILFGDSLIEKPDGAATSRGPDRASEDADGVKSDDLDSPTDFFTPRETTSDAYFDHRGEPCGTSDLGDNSNSDGTATLTRGKTSSDMITSIDALIQSESDSVTPQTSGVTEDGKSSSNATPIITSSSRSYDASDLHSWVDAHTVDNPAATMGQIEDSSNLSFKESNRTSLDERIYELTQTSTADPTEVGTENSVSNLPKDSNNGITNSPTQQSVEGSRNEDIGDTEQNNIDESSKESVSDSSESNSEHSVEETHEDEHDPNFSVAASEPVSGMMGLKWAYATHTPADNMLVALGIWLFEKPPGHFRWQPYVWKRKGLGIEQAPVVIDTLGDATTLPKAEFDNQILYINTHTVPWADLRANYAHPDTLFPAKLVEYQAAESMGLNVWRHDRNLLDCRLLSCRAKVADHNPASVVCPGCGPKTIIRYCSVTHMVADLREHWLECGHQDLVIKRVVDQTTAPARFGRLCPAIRDSHNTKSYALYRQGLYAMLSHGRYTLFDWETEEPTVLVWTGEDVRKGEMERRVERLLNLALFDQRNKAMVGVLFRLLRQCLQLKNSWNLGTTYALKKQFGEEFGLDGSKVEEDR